MPSRESGVSTKVVASGSFLPVMPTAVTSFGAASDGRYAYVLGGYFGTPHQYTRAGQSRTISRLPLDGSGRWETIGELPRGVQGLAAVAYDGALCRFGGNEIHGTAEQMRSVDTAACFDVATRRFEALPPMPAGRSSHDAARIGDTVYVAGGWRLEGRPADARFHDTMVAIDLSSDAPAWRSIDVPFERRAVGVAAAAGKLFVLGGLTPAGELSRHVDVYDPSTGAFSRAPDFPADAFGVAAVGMGDTVYASARDGVLYGLTVGDEAWQPIARLAFARFFHELVPTSDGAVVAIGGISGMHEAGRTRPVERLEPSRRSPSVGVLELPYPGRAKNRQAALVHGDFLYLFGGNDSLEQHAFAPDNFVDDGLRMHLPSLRWERLPPYPAARQTISVVAGDEVAYFVGGFGHDGEQAVSSAEAFAFDFAAERFEPRSGLPRSRTQFGLAAHGDSLYVFGGLNYDPAREGDAAFDHVLEVLRAPSDLSAPFAPSGSSLPGPRRAFAGAVLGDRYYLIGGMREGFAVVEDCQAFDFPTGDFVEIPCPSAPRVSGDLVALGGALYLVGGSTLDGGDLVPSTTIEVFDPSAGRWSTLLEQLPFDTRHMRAFAFGGRLLLVSTHNEEGRLHLAFVDPGVRP